MNIKIDESAENKRKVNWNMKRLAKTKNWSLRRRAKQHENIAEENDDESVEKEEKEDLDI
jgi:hypothetical protein